MKIILAAVAASLVIVQANSGGGARPASGGNGKSSEDKKPQVQNSGNNKYPYPSDLRDYIVEKHNWARANLVPSGEACNMRQVSWDESLAISAADHVEKCQFEHFTEDYAYGQNLMYGGQTLDKPLIDGWIKAWVEDEISEGDRQGNGLMDLDHASAVLWADTYLVGCASKLCPNGYLTACNYFNPGNWEGERAYIQGKPCSQCPSQAPYCDASGKLCTADPNGGGAKPPAYGPSGAPPAPGAYPAPAPGGNTPTAPGANQVPAPAGPSVAPGAYKPMGNSTKTDDDSSDSNDDSNDDSSDDSSSDDGKKTPCPTPSVRPTPCPSTPSPVHPLC